MNIRNITLILMLVALPAGLSALAQAEQIEDKVTVITSDKLLFDYQNKYATFEGNVVVTDPDMKLTSELLTVRFNEEGDATYIEARGKVYITQLDKTAIADHAVYDVISGKIVLEGDPRVRRGKDLLSGDKITFWRNESRMICEPNAKLVIRSGSMGGTDMLLGD